MIKSRCGIDCDGEKCRELFNIECRGCANMYNPFWGECPVKGCCEGRNLENCGFCDEFPCELLNSFAYDSEQGDDGKRIEQCKKWCQKQ